MLVRKCVGQAGVAIGFARGLDAIECGLDGAVAEGVDVDDQSLLVGGDAEFR